MKTCTNCGETKAEEDFNFKSRAAGRRQVHCRHCTRAAIREHYARRTEYYTSKARARNRRVSEELRTRMLAYLASRQCVDCGEADPIVLDFDHCDSAQKTCTIGEMLKNRLAWATIEAEIAKCEIRCANCHRRRTATQFGWYKLWPRSSVG